MKTLINFLQALPYHVSQIRLALMFAGPKRKAKTV